MGVSSDEENDGVGRREIPTSRKRSRGSELPKDKLPKHKRVKFSSETQAKYPCLKADPKDPYKCICKLCDTGKSIRAEKSDINRHGGKGHKDKAALVNHVSQEDVRSMLTAKDPLEKQVKYAELKLAALSCFHS